MRVSSKRQAEEGNSIDTQDRVLTTLANKKGWKVIDKIIVPGVSGTSMDREDVKKIISRAKKKEFHYLLVYDLDRFGRAGYWTLEIACKLFRYGVTLVDRDREYDLNKEVNLILIALRAGQAKNENAKRVNRTNDSRKDAFKKKRWQHQSVPLGYRLVERGNEKWPEKKPEKEEEVWRIFRTFDETCNLSETRKRLRNHGIFMYHHALERMLKKPIYIGRPQWNDVEVEDEKLRFINDELFHSVQEKLEKLEKKRKKKKKHEVDKLVERYGTGFLLRTLSNTAIQCSDCNSLIVEPKPVVLCQKCKGIMVHIGSKKMREDKVDQYRCPSCGHVRRVPSQREKNQYAGVTLLRCPICGETEHFQHTKIAEGWWGYMCRKCFSYFEGEYNPNRFLRRAKKKNDTKGTIKRILRENGRMKLQQIYREIRKSIPGLSKGGIRGALQFCVESGEIERVRRGTYEIADEESDEE